MKYYDQNMSLTIEVNFDGFESFYNFFFIIIGPFVIFNNYMRGICLIYVDQAAETRTMHFSNSGICVKTTTFHGISSIRPWKIVEIYDHKLYPLNGINTKK